MKWYHIPLYLAAVAATAYLWGMFTTLARNDWKRKEKPMSKRWLRAIQTKHDFNPLGRCVKCYRLWPLCAPGEECKENKL